MTWQTPQSEGALPAMSRRTPLSPERVRTAEFSRTPLGRRGLNEDEVRLFLARLAEDLSATDAEKADLRGEINRLRNYYRQQGVDVDGGRQAPVRPDLAAINLMSRAQQAADAQVAQAEEYCRRLVHQAREYYDRVLHEATQQANEAAERVAATYDSNSGGSGGGEGGVEREALEQRIAWLHTFAEVTQVQLRSVLEALTREVDKLGELPDASGTHMPATRHAVGPPARIGR